MIKSQKERLKIFIHKTIKYKNLIYYLVSLGGLMLSDNSLEKVKSDIHKHNFFWLDEPIKFNGKEYN